jgi:hypothetical protein
LRDDAEIVIERMYRDFLPTCRPSTRVSVPKPFPWLPLDVFLSRKVYFEIRDKHIPSLSVSLLVRAAEAKFAMLDNSALASCVELFGALAVLQPSASFTRPTVTPFSAETIVRVLDALDMQPETRRLLAQVRGNVALRPG